MLHPSEPRSLRSMDAIARRRAMLDLPHMSTLCDFTAELREEGRGAVPDFDPMDAGVGAKVLFLMEKPGPMTDDTALAGRTGSGFISRDNDDPTAEAIFRFMLEAGFKREDTLLWNTIPWWNGTRAITPGELAEGVGRLDHLIDYLPDLKAVVGVGARAKKARKKVEERGLPFILSAHPSPINRASRPSVWSAIPGQWAEAFKYL